jgi:hypothetical protein
MADTGAPWNIPYAEPAELVRDWPALSEDVAEAVAAGLSAAGYNSSQTITATDATWPVPTLTNPIVKVTVIGGGGGGGASTTGIGGTGGTSSFIQSPVSVSASGGVGGRGSANSGSATATQGFASGNGGGAGSDAGTNRTGTDGQGGSITVAYVDLTGLTTVAVTIGAGGTAGSGTGTAGAAGGQGVVIVEYAE